MTPERFRTLKAALLRRQPDLTVLADDVHKPHNIAAAPAHLRCGRRL